MIIKNAESMRQLGKEIAKDLRPPVVIELVGDVGVGKSTLVQGIAHGLGVKEGVTSPSFTLVKEYIGSKYNLAHYDFYRLNDPGILTEDLNEKMQDQNTITIIEWGQSIKDFLPKEHIVINIKYHDDGSREVEIEK